MAEIGQSFPQRKNKYLKVITNQHLILIPSKNYLLSDVKKNIRKRKYLDKLRIIIFQGKYIKEIKHIWILRVISR